MRRLSVGTVLGLLLAGAAYALANARIAAQQDSQATAPTPRSTDYEGCVAQALVDSAAQATGATAAADTVDAIAQVRKELNVDLLAGTAFDQGGETSDREKEFKKSLGRILERGDRPPESETGEGPPSVSDPRPIELEASRLVGVLRGVSERLDGVANDLERCRLYESGDTLRQAADQLRREARQLDTP
jgi:hypothetical protein